MVILRYIESWNMVSIALRLILATVFGGLIGLERSTHRHYTGLRTFALVCLGAALASMTNIYLAQLNGLNADVSRIPAGVVSGIGFLGAGSILVTGKNQIKGLTTAASLWTSSMMGIALGAGFIYASILSFVLILISNKTLQCVSHRIVRYNRYMTIYFEVDSEGGISKLRGEMEKLGFKIITINKTKQKSLNNSDVVVTVEMDLMKKLNHQELMNYFSGLDYISYLEEI